MPVDANGDVIDGVGGGGSATEYTEDAPAVANPVGPVQMLVRSDTPASVSSADGDVLAQRGTDYGAALVTIVDNAGAFATIGGGTQYDEDTAHAAAEKLTMAGVVRKDTAESLVGADSDRTSLIVNATGQLHVTTNTQYTLDAAAGSAVMTIAGAIRKDTVGTQGDTNGDAVAIQQDSEGWVRVTGKNNVVTDAAAGATVVVGMVGAVRKDSAAALAGTDGDATPLQVNSSGELRVTGGGGGTQYVEDDAAAANPTGTVPILVRKDTPAAVATTDGDNVGQRGNNYGAAYVTPLNQTGVPAIVDRDTQAVAAEPLHMMGAVRTDTAAALAGTDGDRAPLQLDATGALRVVPPTPALDYGSASTLTWTLTSLADAAARECTLIDGEAAGYADYAIRVLTKGQAASTGNVDLYIYSSVDDGVYTDGLSGADAAVTFANLRNSRYLGSIRMNGTAAVCAMFFLSDVFKGAIPAVWGLVAHNMSGGTLSATGGDHVAKVQGIY